MPISVEIDERGVVAEFPDDTSEDTIHQIITEKFFKQPDEKEPKEEINRDDINTIVTETVTENMQKIQTAEKKIEDTEKIVEKTLDDIKAVEKKITDFVEKYETLIEPQYQSIQKLLQFLEKKEKHWSKDNIQFVINRDMTGFIQSINVKEADGKDRGVI